MAKKMIYAIVAVFVAWAIIDFVIHSLILGSAYQETAALWRPMDEMKMGLAYFTTLIFSIVFVYIYAKLFKTKDVKTAVLYGMLIGIGVGIPMGYGTYAVMPIPYHMALVWFLGTLVETTLGGLLLGLIIKE